MAAVVGAFLRELQDVQNGVDLSQVVTTHRQQDSARIDLELILAILAELGIHPFGDLSRTKADVFPAVRRRLQDPDCTARIMVAARNWTKEPAPQRHPAARAADRQMATAEPATGGRHRGPEGRSPISPASPAQAPLRAVAPTGHRPNLSPSSSSTFRARRQGGSTARFSEVFGIQRDADDDWFDPVCSTDTRLFLDPQLAFEDKDPLWAESRTVLDTFVDRAVIRTRTSKREFWNLKVARWLHFPEPAEFGLGLTQSGIRGSGIGSYLAGRLAGAFTSAYETVRGTFNLESLTILADGIGPDRVSDLILNLMKSRFIRYTQEVALRHSLPTSHSSIGHAAFNDDGWLDGLHRLPHRPDGTPILLVPSRFLRASYGAEHNQYFDWLISRIPDSSAARDFLNRQIGEVLRASQRDRLDARGRARVATVVAREFPGTVMDYLAGRSAIRPYDLGADTQLRFGWLEMGRAAGLRFSTDASTLASLPPSALIDDLLSRTAAALSDGALERAFFTSGSMTSAPRPRDQWMPVLAVFLTTILEQADFQIRSDPMKVGAGVLELERPGAGRRRWWLEFQLDKSGHDASRAPTVVDATLVGIQFVRGDGQAAFDRRAIALESQLHRSVRRIILHVGRNSNSPDRITRG